MKIVGKPSCRRETILEQVRCREMWGTLSKRHRLALPRSLPVLVLIFLSVSGVSSNVSFNESSSVSWLRKCCPPREIFPAGSQVDCVPASNRAMELHGMSRDTRSQTSSFPKCNDPEDIAMTPVDLIGSNDNVTNPICLEVLRNESSSHQHPVVVHCRSSMGDTKQEASKLSPPKIITVRRCCPKDMLYDPRTRSCVSLLPEVGDVSFISLEDPFLSLLPNTNSVEIDFLAVARGPPGCHRVIFDYPINARDLRFSDSALKASLSLNRDGWRKEEIELTAENACLELTPESASSKGGELILRLCREEAACSKKPCVVKCCREDQFRLSQRGCRNYDGPNIPFDFHKMLSNATVEEKFFGEDYGVLVGNPCKHGSYYVEPEVDWNITPNGYLQLSKFEVYKHREYCMDIFYNITEFRESLVPFICFDMEPEDTCELRCRVKVILQSISCVFLLITLVVYACLPVLQNLHGKTLMCHVASLFTAFSCLVISSVLTPQFSEDSVAKVSCSLLGYTMLFSFVSAFAWLNVMCFDIWWTFGGLRENMSTRGRRHRKRFLLYNTYSWGLASVITGLAIMVDNTEILPIYLQPRIGEGSCWFTSGKNLHGEVLFFIGPVTLQSIMNVVLFVMTTIHCNKVKAEINRVTMEPSDARNKRFQANRTKLVMNIKLFIVMGVSWTMEILSYFLNNYLVDLKWREEFFYVSDVFNCLQGVLIFALFVLKGRVYHALRKRLGFEDTRQGSSNVTTVHDPSRIKKSVSNSTLMSTFQVSVAP